MKLPAFAFASYALIWVYGSFSFKGLFQLFLLRFVLEAKVSNEGIFDSL